VGGHCVTEIIEGATLKELGKPVRVVYEHDLYRPFGVASSVAATCAGLLRGVLGAVKVKVSFGYLRQGVAAVRIILQDAGKGLAIPYWQHRHREEGGQASHLGARDRLAHSLQQGFSGIFRI
jgi:hypothetical protein